MKAIMISIKPKWVAKILNGEKTIEIRKTMPKCELPIDVYIYCTKDNKTKLSSNSLQYYVIDNKDYKDYLGNWNGKVLAKFTLNKVEEIRFDDKEVQRKACLTEDELFDYLFINEPYHEDMKKGYAWHISNLEIFDKPKELKNGWFTKRDCRICPFNHEDMDGDECIGCIIEKAPQNYCYVEVDK